MNINPNAHHIAEIYVVYGVNFHKRLLSLNSVPHGLGVFHHSVSDTDDEGVKKGNAASDATSIGSV